MGVLRSSFVLWALLSALTTSSIAFGDDAPKSAPEENWATKQARTLTSQGRAAAGNGQADVAIRRFLDAIELDGTYGPAYLALADLRTRSGEVDEAEKVLDLGLDRIVGFSEGLRAKAELKVTTKRFDAATSLFVDVLKSAPDDRTTLERLIEVATKADRLPVALGAARKLHALAVASGNESERKNAASTVRVLMKLLGSVDPVLGTQPSRERARRALARFRPR